MAGDGRVKLAAGDVIDDAEEWEVETIRDRKKKGQDILYKVRWVGDWPKNQKETWEPEEHLRHAREHVEAYDTAFPRENNLAQKAGTSQGAGRRKRKASV